MSLGSSFVNWLLKAVKFNGMYLEIEKSKGNAEQFSEIVKKNRMGRDCKNPPNKLFSRYEIREMHDAGHATYLMKTKEGNNRRLIMFFHGGAYMFGPFLMHWKTLSKLADYRMHDIAVLDYPKSPEYTCERTIDYCVRTYKRIISENNYTETVFLGDSAGGGLALSLFMKLRDLDMKLPDKLILLSPWLDVSMSNNEMREYIDKDLILTIDGLIECGKYYAGDTDTNDWLVSPKFGDLKSLPETHVFAGGSELFLPDCRDFVNNAQDNKLNAKLHFYEDMQHDWPLISFLPEAKRALKEISELL